MNVIKASARHGAARLRSRLVSLGRLWPRPPREGAIDVARRARAQEIVEELIALTQRRTELAFGVVRIIFCLCVLGRFVLLNDLLHTRDPGGSARAWFEFPAMLGPAFASLPLMIRAAHGRVPAWGVDASALVDIFGAHLSLLGGVVHPWPTYRGLLHMPDVAVVPVLCLAAGLRMSARTAILATATNGVLLAGLTTLDLSRNYGIAAYGFTEIYLYGLYLVAAGSLGILLVVRARSVASAAASHALRAEVVRDGLAQVLQDRHDVASLLSSARINAELLTRELQRHDGERRLLSSIESSLLDLTRIVEDSRDLAYTELASSARMERVDAAVVIEALLTSLRNRYSAVQFVCHRPGAGQALVWVTGGSRGLERVLLNLLVNAVEGRGQSQAGLVELELVAHGRELEIVVSDDGPGFRADQLERRREGFGSTKRRGSGLGLLLVERVVTASRGSLRLENLESGARVYIRLRADEPAE